jgi:hypothetical protein
MTTAVEDLQTWRKSGTVTGWPSDFDASTPTVREFVHEPRDSWVGWVAVDYRVHAHAAARGWYARGR